MTKKLSRVKLKLNRIKKKINNVVNDKKKLDTAKEIRQVLTDKEYNTWVKLLSKCGTPDEQETITADYFKEIEKYEQLKHIVRII